MAEESLIVRLDAKTQALDAKLQSTNEKLDKLTETTKRTDKGFFTLTQGMKKAAAKATALATAVALITAKTVQYAKELTIASTRNGENIEKMQAWAFAANTVGVSLEKLGDIGKDTNEKISEFIATGGGGFQDFADVMGLTATEAKALANEFEEMSGTDVLQEMVKRMDEGGISAGQMSFALEGMASDTTDLIPLLKDGSTALKALTDDFDAMNVALTQEDINKITAIGKEFSKMTAKLSGESRQAVADYAQEIATAIKVTTEFLVTTGNVFSLIATGWGNILEISQAAVTDMVNGTDTLTGVLQERAALTSDVIKKLSDDVKAGAESIAEDLKVLDIGGGDDDSTSEGGDDEESPTIKKINREIEAIKDRFKTEQELLEQKFEREQALLDVEIEDIKERNAIKLQLFEEFEENTALIKLEARQKERDAVEQAESKERKARDKLDKDKRKQDKVDDKNAKDNAKRDENIVNGAMALASLAFSDNKEISAGIAFVNTAQGVTKALSVQDYAGAITTAAMGAGQIAAILGASKGGGGSIPSVTAPAPTNASQSDFLPETTGLELSDSDGGGSSIQTIRFATDSGDDIINAIAGALNKGQEEGRF
jgi:chromosome segregation ATPase